eukprot:SAG11_NODE_1612_length_4580_cov_7.854050_3_plen_189_part_00
MRSPVCTASVVASKAQKPAVSDVFCSLVRLTKAWRTAHLQALERAHGARAFTPVVNILLAPNATSEGVEHPALGANDHQIQRRTVEMRRRAGAKPPEYKLRLVLPILQNRRAELPRRCNLRTDLGAAYQLAAAMLREANRETCRAAPRRPHLDVMQSTRHTCLRHLSWRRDGVLCKPVLGSLEPWHAT